MIDAYHIIGIVLKNRHSNAVKLQEIMTEYGSLIKTRLGIHETREERDHGLMVLHAEGDEAKINELVAKINSLDYVEAKVLKLTF